MNILWLGPERPHLFDFLRQQGDSPTCVDDPLEAADPLCDSHDWLVSYGYRYILKPAVLDRFSGRAINLHISFLPWNRGADPNLWSFLEDTPKGVTIHQLDTGVDTGPILAQQAVPMGPEDTLKTSYDKLSQSVEQLFCDHWPAIKAEALSPIPQPSGGSVHRLADKQPYESLLIHGWDTPVSTLMGKAKSE